MEHLYKYRKVYGVETNEDGAGMEAILERQRLLLAADEAAFFINLQDNPNPQTVLWVCRQIHWGSVTLIKYLWSSGKEIFEEIKNGSLIMPGFLLNLRHFSPMSFFKKSMSQYVQEFQWVKEGLRPVAYGLRVALQEVDVPTKTFAILLSSVTAYLLWRSHVYMRHLGRGNEVDMRDKVVLITGGNSGIGERLVYEFIERGAIVIIVASDITRTLQVVENVHRWMAIEIGTPEYEYDRLPSDGYRARPEDFLYPLPHLQPEVPDYVKKLHYLQLDLGDSQTIWRAVYHIFEVFDHIDVIINNGAIHLPDSTLMSPDGLEAHFSINYYGHFILTNLILSFMDLPSERTCKIINVLCKEAFCEGALTMEQIEQAFDSKGVMDCSYARSKLCNYCFHQELTKRLEAADLQDVIRTYAVSPPICETNLKRHFPLSSKWEGWIPGLSADAGAQTILHCVLSQECESQTGLYYEHCHVSTPKLFGYRYLDKEFDKICQRLWDITEESTQNLIDFYKTDDKPLPRGNCYGGAVFREATAETDMPEDPDPDEELEEPPIDDGWIPKPVRELIEFRKYYTSIFMRPRFQQEWKDSVCNRGLIDLYTAINGPLRFAPRPNPTKIPTQDDFDPLYDRPPIPINTKNSWIY